MADRASIQAAVAGLDLARARLLTRLSLFWVRRVRCAVLARDVQHRVAVIVHTIAQVTPQLVHAQVC